MLFDYHEGQGSSTVHILNIYIRSSRQKFETCFILVVQDASC